MKTLTIAFAACLMAATAFGAKADGTRTATDKMSMKYAVTIYIDAFSQGKLTGLAEILDENVKLTTSSGTDIRTYSKSDIIYMLKPTRDVEQNCKTSYSVIESLPNQVVVKVNMKYNAFTKVNYVTMAQTVKGWKITNISTVFQGVS
ncbi:hypothetical protein [Hufsiella ginkgonis]|uniref:Nuclear transport factor 2 family protein n=1 Tax=Hufsiella ginkgonis TaxID=2695274 RepID=A0A7K1Y4M4_9SPHI|nr:hypothetical protein [Hufsiella ginkgonis]MXV17807.1 hypothetical protein [Hufsiella ginkgonis]